MKDLFIKPSFLKPHYSTKICRSIFNYLEKNYEKGLFDKICRELRVPAEFLLADDNWVSHEFSTELKDAVIKFTGDADIYFKIGRSLLTPENINPLEYSILKGSFPLFFFASYPKQFMKVNQILHFQVSEMGLGKVVLTAKPKTSEIPGKEVFDNLLGSFYSFKDLYQLDGFEVHERQSTDINGINTWTYEVKYSVLRFWLRRLPIISGALTALGLLYFGISNSGSTTETILALFSLIACGFGFITFKKYKNLLDYNSVYYENTQQKNHRIFETSKKLDRRYQESNLLRDLSYSLLQETDPERIIASCLTDIEFRFKYEKVIVMLLSDDGNSLSVADHRGFHGNQQRMIEVMKFAYPAKSDSKYMFANILSEGKTQFFVDEELEALKREISPTNKMITEALNVNSLVVSPIQGSDNKYGLIIIGATTENTKLAADDQHLMENISRMFSLFFENAKSYKNEQTLRTVFQQYVPREVLTSMDNMQGASSGFLETKQNFITCFFSDLRGFTAISETMPPEKVVDLVNIYIGFVTERLAKHGGIIANLIGDGVFAFFPSNEELRTEHADRALQASLEILRDFDQLEMEFRRKGYPAPSVGIGLHSGFAVIGSVGAKSKLSYTAMGDTVNVSSRLESLSKEVNTMTESAKRAALVISEETFKRAKQPVSSLSIGSKLLKGRDKPVECLLIDIDMAKGLPSKIKPAA